jgi:hypothetical protein
MHAGRALPQDTPALEARILEATRKAPPDGSTHWSTRKLAAELGVSHMRVARVWRKAGLRPHRVRSYMASDDPEFEKKAADVIGLYLKPPVNAVVFCVDEKTAIQALDRLDPVLPLSPGRAERHGFEYFRHGTLSLYAALNTQTGEVTGKTAGRHTSAEFVAFLSELWSQQPKDSGDSRHRRQSFRAQNGARERVFGNASPSAPALHADLLVMAQPSGVVVFENRTGCDRARRFYFSQRSGPQTHALHPRLQ